MTSSEPRPTAEREGDEAPETTPPLDLESVGEALAGLVEQVADIRAQAERLIDIRLDRARVSLRESGQRMALRLLAAGVVFTFLLAAAYFVMAGLVGAVAELADGRVWVGQLVVGLAGLVVTYAAAVTLLGRLTTRQREAITRKYEGPDG